LHQQNGDYQDTPFPFAEIAYPKKTLFMPPVQNSILGRLTLTDG
jgi:hypothetical protein